MFIVNVAKNSITVEGKELITSGSVKTNFVQFDFDEEWTGLTKTVIFQTKKVSIPIILEEGVRYQLPIPWEVMAYPNETINVGVYGVRKDDEETAAVDEEIVLPTIWGTIGKVTQGVLVPNPPTTPPTADSYLQLLAYIDRLIGSGGGGGPSIPGIDGVSPIITTEELPDGAGVRVIVTDVEGEKSFDIFNGLNGQDGKDGEPGTPGKDGVNGKDGESGATFIPTVSEEGVISWENDKGLPNPPSVNIKGPPGENGTGGSSILGDIPVIPITKSEYEELSDEEKQADIAYLIPDDNESGGNQPPTPESPSNNIYSTEETRIGTWINGKPVYRKCFSLTTPPSSTSKYYDETKIESFEYMVGTTVIVFYNNAYIQTNYLSSAGQFLSGFDNIGRLWIACTMSSVQNKACVAVLEYTKITDEPEV